MTDIENYKNLIATNIELDILYETAKRHGADEVGMVTEIYESICDMVTIPRDKVVIKQTEYPWNIVKGQFLKLKRVRGKYPKSNCGRRFTDKKHGFVSNFIIVYRKP